MDDRPLNHCAHMLAYLSAVHSPRPGKTMTGSALWFLYAYRCGLVNDPIWAGVPFDFGLGSP